jgi:hypothetical protein
MFIEFNSKIIFQKLPYFDLTSVLQSKFQHLKIFSKLHSQSNSTKLGTHPTPTGIDVQLGAKAE